jgi:hypothetical protein
MVSPVSCWRVIRVDARAPFVRGRLEARRHAQKYLRVICRTRSPFDGVRGLDALAAYVYSAVFRIHFRSSRKARKAFWQKRSFFEENFDAEGVPPF